MTESVLNIRMWINLGIILVAVVLFIIGLYQKAKLNREAEELDKNIKESLKSMQECISKIKAEVEKDSNENIS